jgi:hypothetical protein
MYFVQINNSCLVLCRYDVSYVAGAVIDSIILRRKEVSCHCHLFRPKKYELNELLLNVPMHLYSAKKRY